MKYPLGWIIQIFVRIGWTFVPHSGYIHPDEFFQTSEVIAGDVLKIEIHRPWEYNSTFPIRSIILPSLICGPSYWLLRLLRSYNAFPGPFAPPSYWMLIGPRVVVAVISIFMDIMVAKTALNLGMEERSTLLCCATSYVSMVYLTRSFTNTFEAFLFTVLFFYTTKPEKHKNPKDNWVIACVVVSGIFNRPTFVAFAFVPCVYWVLRPSGSKFNLHVSLSKIIKTGIYAVIFSVLFILVDALYFNFDTFFNIFAQDTNFQFPQNLITPWNFLMYNIDSSNLATHGLHPRFTHMFVNLPVLFGPCSLVVYTSCVLLMVAPFATNKAHVILTLSITIPVLILSIFPHQEARFLVPLLTPVAILCSNIVFARKLPWRILRISWLIFNILGAVVFGVLHQGGVIGSTIYLQQHLNEQLNNDPTYRGSEYNVIYFHTYMPPQHLFSKPLDSLNSHQDNLNHSVSNNVHIHDLKGAPIDSLLQKLKILQKSNSRNIVVTPATVAIQLCDSTNLKIDFKHNVWPHLSFEDPPDIKSIWTGKQQYHNNCYPSNNITFMENLMNSFSLQIFYSDLK